MAEKSVIANLETRMRVLIDDHRRLAALCRTLTAERDALKASNRSLEERIRSLDAELGRRQLAEGFAGSAQNRDKARARVNRLMREVDKCIALVGALEGENARTKPGETK